MKKPITPAAAKPAGAATRASAKQLIDALRDAIGITGRAVHELDNALVSAEQVKEMFGLAEQMIAIRRRLWFMADRGDVRLGSMPPPSHRQMPRESAIVVARSPGKVAADRREVKRREMIDQRREARGWAPITKRGTTKRSAKP